VLSQFAKTEAKLEFAKGAFQISIRITVSSGSKTALRSPRAKKLRRMAKGVSDDGFGTGIQCPRNILGPVTDTTHCPQGPGTQRSVESVRTCRIPQIDLQWLARSGVDAT
jgi:hypothetical protein